MRRATLWTALIAIAVGSSCASSTGKGTTSRRVRSATYSYSIELPPGWSMVSAQRRLGDSQAPVTGLPVTDIFARHATRRIRQLTLPALVVGAQPVSRTEALPSWTAKVIGIVRTFKGCAAPASVEPIEIGGAAAALLSYPNCPPGQELYHLWTVSIAGGQGFQIVWFNRPGAEAQDRVVLDRLLRSISFSK